MKRIELRLLLVAGLVAFVAVPAFAARPNTQKLTHDNSPVVDYEDRMRARRAAAEEKMARHPRFMGRLSARVTKARRPAALSEKVIKRAVPITHIMDGMVFYHLGDTARKKGESERAWRTRLSKQQRTAILMGDTQTRLLSKVGKVVTLHIKTDSRGFAHVVDVTR